MEKKVTKKIIILGIITLFIGISIVPSITGDIKEISVSSFKQNIEIKKPKQTSFVNPIERGWSKTFGGTDEDIGYSVQQTTDKGYIITGETSSFGAGNTDVWLIKTDENGNGLWSRTFGGIGPDSGRSVQQTNDGGYIIAGNTGSYGPGTNAAWLIKTNASGVEQWNRTFGENDPDHGYVSYSVQQITDGGYIMSGGYHLGGMGQGSVWLIKTNASGIEQWNRTLGGTVGYSVKQTNDGGFIVGATYYESVDGCHIRLIKTGIDGFEQWSRDFGLGGFYWDYGYSAEQTTDGGYVIAGVTSSYDVGGGDFWLIKTNMSGFELWNSTFGGVDHDWGYSVEQTIDGGFIITGYTTSYGAGLSDVWLVKTDVNGNELWNKTFGGIEGDSGLSVQQTTDGGYIIIGKTLSYGAGGNDVWLIKVDSQNQPPNKPNKPSGETSGKLQTPYIYSTSTTDPNVDQVWYQWDWGDGSTSIWLGPYNSGATINTAHTWTVKASLVKVIAKDSSGVESLWSDPLLIIMPYSYNILLQWFWERLFQRFPNAFSLLRYLMEY